MKYRGFLTPNFFGKTASKYKHIIMLSIIDANIISSGYKSVSEFTELIGSAIFPHFAPFSMF